MNIFKIVKAKVIETRKDKLLEILKINEKNFNKKAKIFHF